MPDFIIAQQSGKIGETFDALLCDPGPAGWPDRRSDTPVRVKFISERTLCVDDEPRRIISCAGENGVAAYLIDGSTRSIADRARRIALMRASALLQQLPACLKPLVDGSGESGLATESLQQVFDWIAREPANLLEPTAALNEAPNPRRSRPPQKRGSAIGVMRRAWRLRRTAGLITRRTPTGAFLWTCSADGDVNR